MIPQASPSLRIARFKSEVDAAVSAVISDAKYVLGARLEEFEHAFADYVGVRHGIGVASGTDAIALALRALDIGAGDEVVLPALTFAATAQAVLHAGAIPCFADVDPVTRCVGLKEIKDAITKDTAAVIVVHLFGFPADMRAIMALARENDLLVIEDCAQAHGAMINSEMVGSFGDAAAYSFYPTKNLGCIGDGGMVVTDHHRLAERVRSLRNYGFNGHERVSLALGYNSRLDDIQAAILTALLPELDAGNHERRLIAAAYRDLLFDSEITLPPDDPGCVYHQFSIAHAGRDGLMKHLAHAGIGTAIHYSPGLHRHPAFSRFSKTPLQITDELAAKLLSLPIQPEVARQHVTKIAAAVKSYKFTS